MKSQGLGDTIDKITTRTGVKRIVKTISKATGKDCGCDEKKEKLNNPRLLINKTFYKL